MLRKGCLWALANGSLITKLKSKKKKIDKIDTEYFGFQQSIHRIEM